jgi:hypothetical protein
LITAADYANFCRFLLLSLSFYLLKSIIVQIKNINLELSAVVHHSTSVAAVSGPNWFIQAGGSYSAVELQLSPLAF